MPIDTEAPLTAELEQSEPSSSSGFGLHMEASYLLECAVELGEITPLEELVFRVENPASLDFMRRTDRNERLPPHWLRNTARQFLNALSHEERLVWALHSLPGLEFGLNALRDRMAFVVQSKVQADLGVIEPCSFRLIDEVASDTFRAKTFSSVHDVAPATVGAYLTEQYGQTRSLLAEDLELCREALLWVQQPANRHQAKLLANRLFLALPHAPSPVLEGVTPLEMARQARNARNVQRRARSAIKKAMKLFSRTGLEDSVRLLVHGKEVTLEHPASPFKFVLQPLQSGWLELRTVSPGGHVPYQLSLLTKDDVFLSRLCVIFDKTPVLDQLLALTFFVQSGNEQELLSKANWFGYEDSLSLRSVLSEKAPELLPKVPARGSANHSVVARNLEHFEVDGSEAHWAPFKAPVAAWIDSWMGGLIEEANLLKGQPRLAA